MKERVRRTLWLALTALYGIPAFKIKTQMYIRNNKTFGSFNTNYWSGPFRKMNIKDVKARLEQRRTFVQKWQITKPQWTELGCNITGIHIKHKYGLQIITKKLQFEKNDLHQNPGRLLSLRKFETFLLCTSNPSCCSCKNTSNEKESRKKLTKYDQLKNSVRCIEL